MKVVVALTVAAASVAAAGAGAETASRAADPGITRTSILLGGTAPLSGEAAAAGATARGAELYFRYVNDRGGVFRRKIRYRYLDDAYDPQRTVQATRQLVQQERVFAIFNPVGTAHNRATRPFLNAAKLPQLFVASGHSGWGKEAGQYPWTLGLIPTYTAEGIVYGRHIARTKPRARIAVLYQDDEYGRELLAGLRRGLGRRARQIVSQQSYDPTASDIGSQVARLKASRANTLMVFAFGKFAIQAFVFVKRLGWKPQIYVNAVAAATSVMNIAKTSGQVEGTISVAFFKDPADARWRRDRGMRLFMTIMRRYGRGGEVRNGYYLAGMASAYTMVETLRKAGRNPTRRSVMNAALRLNIRNNPFALPGVRIQTSRRDRFPIEQMQLERWRNGRWRAFGRLVTAPSR